MEHLLLPNLMKKLIYQEGYHSRRIKLRKLKGYINSLEQATLEAQQFKLPMGQMRVHYVLIK